jgi:hypothetical protein
MDAEAMGTILNGAVVITSEQCVDIMVVNVEKLLTLASYVGASFPRMTVRVESALAQVHQVH